MSGFTPKSPAEIRKLAEAATSGPWSTKPETFSPRIFVMPCDPGPDTMAVGSILERRDARFIAAANPSQIIHDSDLILSLTKEVEGLRAALEPFINGASALPDGLGDHVGVDTSYTSSTGRKKWIRPCTVGDLRRARALSTSGRAET